MDNNHNSRIIKLIACSCLMALLLFLGQAPSAAQETGMAKVIFVVK